MIGAPGAGKSTFSKKLGSITGLPVIHLDKYFWKDGWVMPFKEEWNEMVSELSSTESWIMDGNYRGTMKMRMEKSDAVFFFDFPPAFCVYRIFKRILKSKVGIEPRYDLNENCPEKWFDSEFVKFTWSFRKNYAPFNYEILRELNYPAENYFNFKNPSEVKTFLNSIKLF